MATRRRTRSTSVMEPQTQGRRQRPPRKPKTATATQAEPREESTMRRVYMMTDMEGVAGVDDWDPRHRDYAVQAKGVYDRAEVQRLLTGEVNAAAEALFEAGVDEVLINDGHGAGRTILPEELISGVRIVRGLHRPQWLPGLTSQYDALVQVGMHARTGTPMGNLAHSMSRNMIYRVNGREVGEMGMAALLAGQVGVPWVFTSGDSHACRESEEWVPGIVTAPVKEGIGELAAIHMAPVDARALIRTKIKEAIARTNQIEPTVIEGEVEFSLTRPEPGPVNVPDGVERVDAFTTRIVAPDFWSAFYGLRGVDPLPVPT